MATCLAHLRKTKGFVWLELSDKACLLGKEFKRELTARSHGVTVKTSASVFSAPASHSTKLLFHNSPKELASFASRCPRKLTLGFCERKRLHLLVYLRSEFSSAMLPSSGGSSSWLSRDLEEQSTEVLEWSFLIW